MSDRQYLQVVGEPFLSACENWRERYIAARIEMSKFAEEFGATGLYVGFNGKLYGLAPVHPLPVGWKLSGRRSNQFMEPRKDAINLRSRMAALPTDPSYDELRDLVGCPTTVNYVSPKRRGSCGICMAVHPVQIIWSAGTPIVLIVPDATDTIASILRDNPDATITRGAGWEVPDGLKRISENEWKLMEAQAAVELERSKEEAA